MCIVATIAACATVKPESSIKKVFLPTAVMTKPLKGRCTVSLQSSFIQSHTMEHWDLGQSNRGPVTSGVDV
uniref:Uncharacterized protein n=1 Tax=Anguilla anguilla TaxID=7936 RepID=A0A0E9X562_ANGAN